MNKKASRTNLADSLFFCCILLKINFVNVIISVVVKGVYHKCINMPGELIKKFINAVAFYKVK